LIAPSTAGEEFDLDPEIIALLTGKDQAAAIAARLALESIPSGATTLIDLIKPLFCGTAAAEPLQNFVAGRSLYLSTER
jgi:hypothetical protein